MSDLFVPHPANSQIKTLRAEIIAQRDFVLLELRLLSSELANRELYPPPILNKFLFHLECSKPVYWYEIDQQKAFDILVESLYWQMVYGNTKMTHQEAEEFAYRFLGFFEPSARAFTLDYGGIRSLPYTFLETEGIQTLLHQQSGIGDIVDALLENGVVVVDHKQIGIMWFGDWD